MRLSFDHASRALRLWACALTFFAAAIALPAWAQAPATTRVDLATPAAYTAAPGSSVAITLNWYRVPMAANYLQFMHLVNAGGTTWSLDDHWTTSATWTAGAFTQARTDFVLITGAGVTDETNSQTYKVGTLTVTNTPP